MPRPLRTAVLVLGGLVTLGLVVYFGVAETVADPLAPGTDLDPADVPRTHALSWNRYALTMVLPAPFLVALAGLTYFARPSRFQNQIFSFFVLLDALLTTVIGLRLAAVGANAAYAWYVVDLLYAGPNWLTGLLYLILLSTLDTPLTRPFRHTGVRWAMGLAMGVAAASVIIEPDFWFGGVRPAPWGGWDYTWDSISRLSRLAQELAPPSILAAALIVVFHAWWRAPRGTAERTRAKWFMIAFLVRDALFLAFYALFFFGLYVYIPGFEPIWNYYYVALTLLVFPVLVGYGILKHQVLEIDLRIKLVIRRSTVAGAFVAAFFVGSELLEDLIPVEGTILGLLSAAAVSLALRPLQRLAQGFADRLMPDVQDTPEYRDRRIREIYAAAVEGALADDAVDATERDVLRRLREVLGISDTVAEEVERGVRMSKPSMTHPHGAR